MDYFWIKFSIIYFVGTKLIQLIKAGAVKQNKHLTDETKAERKEFLKEITV